MRVGATDEALYREFGRRLRAARRGANLTQAHLGARLGLSRTSICNIESGRQRIPLHYAYSLASAIRRPLEELLPDAAVLSYERVLSRMEEGDRNVVNAFIADAKRDSKVHASTSA
jgi:transcriptional regulator with XRE-family HTH domain